MLELEPRPADFRDCATIDGEQTEQERAQSRKDMRLQYANSVIDDEVHMEAVRRTVKHVDDLIERYGREDAERHVPRECWRTWLRWESTCRPKDAKPREDIPHHGMMRLEADANEALPPRGGNEILAREIVDDPAMRGQWWVLPGLILTEDELDTERRLWRWMPVRDGRYRFETLAVQAGDDRYGLAVMLPV